MPPATPRDAGTDRPVPPLNPATGLPLRDPTADSGALTDLLAGLDDAELAEYVAYWQWRWDTAARGLDGWWCSKHVAAGEREQARRAGADSR